MTLEGPFYWFVVIFQFNAVCSRWYACSNVEDAAVLKIRQDNPKRVILKYETSQKPTKNELNHPKRAKTR